MPRATFPILDGPDIPWWLAEYLYEHAGRIWHGDQSLERLAQRGGWGRSELAYMLVSGSPFNPSRDPRRKRKAAPMPLLEVLKLAALGGPDEQSAKRPSVFPGSPKPLIEGQEELADVGEPG